MRRFAVIIALPALVSATTATTQLDVSIEGVRNQRGLIHACLTADEHFFPDCRKDPQALKRTAPATTRNLIFTGYPPGDYALTVVHDENGNQRLDTMLGIPKEGFGFSRNPVVRFGAPRFKQVDIKLELGFTRAAVRMQYIL
ncbi:DUF2141 domain-containing protein [Sphingomonas sinipercae]|uniref:DUF2141 domain-containing protein n=1 Tax=Sphingomonas sinipercae TaxID=2714944 RepID=A0A6G7ZMG3_9SPHN|nr:DUF2141 domain-containing protein [Sphingomonas sinipercae]QIL02108.1 DUF2141 domain-containing protein [Sphingomonas sinipercae]